MRIFAKLCALVLAALPSGAMTEASFVGAYHWMGQGTGFGGFSSLAILDDGQSFLATTDRGYWASGRLQRDGTEIVDVSANLRKMVLADGSNQFSTDAEGLAISDNGQLFVSFEGQHRVSSFGDQTQTEQAMPVHRDFEGLQKNSSLEALAIDGLGRLYTIPERSGLRTRPFPVYRFDGTMWSQPFSIPRRKGHLIVGADIFEDRLYVLERDFTGIGFRSRVRAFDLNGENEVTLIDSQILTHDNLEGISVWRDSPETLRITMLSDNNFRSLQRTEFVEYRIND
ncbi:MAG: esterase-like activity of phytase family protein [Paracoccaceae bacterium]|nr:esterase-like activity of phytase family protein [Paracoccaceae bacterium]